MEVDDGLFRSFADGFPDDLTIRHYDSNVWAERFKVGCNFGNFFRLPNGDAVSECDGFDFRWNGTALAAAYRFIWLRDQDTRLRAMLDEVVKGRECDVSGGDEGEFHEEDG